MALQARPRAVGRYPRSLSRSRPNRGRTIAVSDTTMEPVSPEAAQFLLLRLETGIPERAGRRALFLEATPGERTAGRRHPGSIRLPAEHTWRPDTSRARLSSLSALSSRCSSMAVGLLLLAVAAFLLDPESPVVGPARGAGMLATCRHLSIARVQLRFVCPLYQHPVSPCQFGHPVKRDVFTSRLLEHVYQILLLWSRRQTDTRGQKRVYSLQLFITLSRLLPPDRILWQGIVVSRWTLTQQLRIKQEEHFVKKRMIVQYKSS